jgi:uncharacterized protein involved in outer membrane biogenesis
MKWNWILGIVFLIVVSLIATILVVLTTFDFNSMKPEVAQRVREATGRELTIGGNIEFKLALNPILSVENVRFQNALWGSRSDLATLKRLEMQVAFLPLFWGTITIKRMLLYKLDILIETNSSGQSNLELSIPERKTKKLREQGEDAEEGKIPSMHVSQVQVEKGLVTYKNGQTGTTHSMKLASLIATVPNLESPIHLSLKDSLKDLPLEIKGTLPNFDALIKLPDETRIIPVTDFEILQGDNDLSGFLQLTLSNPQPKLKADLSSKKLDLRSLLKRQEKDQRKDQIPDSDEKKDKVFSQDPISLEALQWADLDASIQARQILLSNLSLHDLSADITLKKGNLRVKPLSFSIGGGSGTGHLDLQSQGEKANLDMSLKIQQLQLGSMLKDLGVNQKIESTLDAEVELKGTGNSPASLMGDLNGRVFLVLGKGRIDQEYLDFLRTILGTDILRFINPSQEISECAEFNCLVSHFDIESGLADSRALVFDTHQTIVVGEGDIDLKTEELNISLKQYPKKGIGIDGVAEVKIDPGELMESFKIGGTLRHPSLDLDLTQTATTIGKAIVGFALAGPLGVVAFLLADVNIGDENPCLAAIEAAKEAEKDGNTGSPAKDDK